MTPGTPKMMATMSFTSGVAHEDNSKAELPSRARASKVPLRLGRVYPRARNIELCLPAMSEEAGKNESE